MRLFYDWSSRFRGVITEAQVYEDYKNFKYGDDLLIPPKITFKQYVDMELHLGNLERSSPKDLAGDHPLKGDR